MNIDGANLAMAATADDRRQLFAPSGLVGHIHVITDGDTGCGTGFAFVEMSDCRATQAAMVGLRG